MKEEKKQQTFRRSSPQKTSYREGENRIKIASCSILNIIRSNKTDVVYDKKGNFQLRFDEYMSKKLTYEWVNQCNLAKVGVEPVARCLLLVSFR